MHDAAPAAILAYCRPGFEGDLAAELMRRSAEADAAGYCQAASGDGVVVFHAVDGTARGLWERVRWHDLVFARQWCLLLERCDALPAADRAGPLARAIRSRIDRVSAIWLEYPDTNEGKSLSRFCRRFAGPLTRRLRDDGVITDAEGAPRLHLFFRTSADVSIAISDPADSAPWPLGIPRLRLPRDAPSRSTLKLDEAIRTFMTDAERKRWLRPGLSAVDLGAALGGWSWQFARRGISVIAVDNGALDARLLADGLVEHIREDGFRYRPPEPVDWLICDIVEQPHRIVRLVAQWLLRDDCRAAIFNLKLPMKQRDQAVADALDRLRVQLDGPPERIRAKQLYHDREEVTVFVRPTT